MYFLIQYSAKGLALSKHKFIDETVFYQAKNRNSVVVIHLKE